MKRKVLTNPSDCYNSLYDNIDGNLVLVRGEYLQKNTNKRFMIIDLLGTGTFGQVVRCVNTDGEEVAIKVVKNSPRHYACEMNEVKILQKLMFKNLSKYFVELKDVFVFREHLCIVQELLGYNLYEILKITGLKGFDHKIVLNIGKQILEGLQQLSLLGISHCDLKPENILVKDYNTFDIKIIDFGSAFSTTQETNFYVQSRYYRSPEVILGVPYNNLCDIWSFGCIIYELYMGHPLFPGVDNSDLIGRIYKLYGKLPRFMLEHGKNTHLHFDKENNYRPYGNINGCSMNEIVEKIRSKNNNEKMDKLLVKFLQDCLDPSHLSRFSSDMLLKHDYIKSEIVSEVTEQIRNQPNPLPSVLMQRRNSEMNIIPEKKIKEKIRKYSVYDACYENKSNI